MNSALIFYGGWEGHTPYETSLAFKKILEENGFKVTMVNGTEILDSFEDIRKFDLFVPMFTMGEITQTQAENISKAVAEGAGIAGCHGGMCDAFRGNTLWQFMTGAQWVAHPGNSEVTYRVKLEASNPFTAGLRDFDYTGEQYYMHIDPAVKVFATTEFPVSDGLHTSNGRVTMPVVFTKMWGRGRVFYLSIGHTAKDFDIPEIRTIMQRGLLWASR